MRQRLVRGAPLALTALAFIVGGCVLNFAATAGGAPVSLARAANSCDITQSKSLSAAVKTEIKFVNKTSGVVKIYWLDYTGKRVYYATLPPGGSLNQATFDTHAWIALIAPGRASATWSRRAASTTFWVPPQRAGEGRVEPLAGRRSRSRLMRRIRR